MDEIMSPARRLSGENWRIFESWKKERANLKEFQEQYVVPHTDAHEEEARCTSLYDLHDSESAISCGHTACHQLSLGDDGSVSKYESCLDTARSSLPVIRQEDEVRVEGVDYHRETSMIRHWFGQRRFAEETNEGNDEPDKILKSDLDEVTLANTEIEGQCFDSEEENSRLIAAVCCLLAIEPFQRYFRGVIYHDVVQEQGEYQAGCVEHSQQKSATLEYVIKVFRKTRRMQEEEKQREISRLAAEFQMELLIAETCFETLKGMLGKLHEEIILAKNNGNLKRTCLRKCRQSNRSNHSIISHLFRGHLKKQDLCPCGYQNISHEPFTSIPLFSSALDEKTLVIAVNTRGKDKTFRVVRYLVQLNQHTYIDDIRCKLSQISSFDPSDLVIASVKNNDVMVVHRATTTAFEAMCEDGELQAFQIIRKRPKGTAHDSEADGDSYPFTSTPAPIDFAEEEGKSHGKESVNPKRGEVITVPVVFQDDGFERCGRNQVPPAFIQIRKTIEGDVVARIPKYLLGATEDECKRIFIVVLRISDNACAVCNEQNCSGCHVTPSKEFSLDRDCKIVIFIPPVMRLKQSTVLEHESFARGVPAKVYTVSEGLAGFRRGENKVACNRCGVERNMESTRTVISYPDFLVLTNNSNFGLSKELLFPSVDFSPCLSKSSKNRKRYDLCGLISYAEGCNKKTEVAYISAAQHEQEKPKSKKRIEILIYINNQHDERKNIKKAVAATSKKRKLRQTINGRVDEAYPKTRPNPLDNSEYKDDFEKNKIKDDETVSTCNCSQCHCWQQCSEQIRRNSFTGIDKIKKDGELHTSRGNLSPLPNLTIQLQRALFKQDLRRIVSLLKRGANPNDLVDGSAAIHFAAGLANPAGYLFTKLLIDYGADVTLKSAAGQTPIQFSTIFGRSETIRLLSYHGADLSDVDKVGDLRSAKSIVSFLKGGSEAISTPQESPVAKRYFEEHCDEDDPYLRTMIQLKKSLALDHEVLNGPKCDVDNMDGLREAGVKAVADKLFPNHKQKLAQSEDTEDKSLETQSLVPLEITGDIAVSDLCDKQGGESPVKSSEDGALLQDGNDEVDGSKPPETDQDSLSDGQIIFEESLSNVQNTGNSELGLSVREDDANSIQYAPKSFVRPTGGRWTNYLCWSSRVSPRQLEKRPRRSGRRGWLRRMLTRASLWFGN